MQYAQVPGGNRNNMKGYIFIKHEPFDIEKFAEYCHTSVEGLYQTLINNQKAYEEMGITGWLVLLE